MRPSIYERGLAMRFTFIVEVEVERTEGKFAPRDEISEALLEAIEGSDPGDIDGIGADGTSTYNTISWDVSEQEQPKAKGKRR